MVTVNLDTPTYLRARDGLAVLSARLVHLLPEVIKNESQQLEPVQINRLFNSSARKGIQQLIPDEQPDANIKGEFIPLNEVEADNFSSPNIEELEQQVEEAQSDATELSFHGQKGKTVTGVYAGSGYHHYRFNKKNGKSFFVRIGKHLIWGIELGAALRRSGAQKGQTITVEFQGKTPIKVLKQVNVDGVLQDDWVDTYRNSWDIRVNQ